MIIVIIMQYEEFKQSFSRYITETTGIFTQSESIYPRCFSLDRFLERQSISIARGIPPSMTQMEMTMALSTFIDIMEGNQQIALHIFPEKTILELKALIQYRMIQLSPYSLIRKGCVEYMDIDNSPVVSVV